MITFIKPAVDAKRVADGNVQHEHSVADPQLELTNTKLIEMGIEAIPSLILQMYALFGAEEVKVSAVNFALDSRLIF